MEWPRCVALHWPAKAQCVRRGHLTVSPAGAELTPCLHELSLGQRRSACRWHGLLTSWEKPSGGPASLRPGGSQVPQCRATVSLQGWAELTTTALIAGGTCTVPSFPVSPVRAAGPLRTAGAGLSVWSLNWQRLSNAESQAPPPTSETQACAQPPPLGALRGVPSADVRSLASGWPDGARGGQSPQASSLCAQWAAPRHFPCDPGCGQGQGAAGKSFPQTCGLGRAP